MRKTVQIYMVILLLAGWYPATTQAQMSSGPKMTSWEKERLDADVSATAYINCEFNLSFKKALENPKDNRLMLEARDANKLFITFDTTMRHRYKDDFEKFMLLVEDSKKEFKVCKDLNELMAQSEKKKEMERLLKEKTEGKKK